MEFIVCQDVFVCYLWIGKVCILNLIYLAGFTYFHFNNTVIYFTIAICIYSTEIDNPSSIYCSLQLFANLEQSYCVQRWLPAPTIYLLFFFQLQSHHWHSTVNSVSISEVVLLIKYIRLNTLGCIGMLDGRVVLTFT